MKKSVKWVNLRNVFIIGILSCLFINGCDPLKEANGVIQKSYTVLVQVQEVLTETQQLVAGSELAEKVGPQIAQAKKSLAVVESTLESIASLMGIDITAPVVAELDNNNALERLKKSTEELEKEQEVLVKKLQD